MGVTYKGVGGLEGAGGGGGGWVGRRRAGVVGWVDKQEEGLSLPLGHIQWHCALSR